MSKGIQMPKQKNPYEDMDDLVRVTDYAAAKGGSYGLPFSVDYSGGKVVVGGTSINNATIDSDNKAWAKASDIDSALDSMKSNLNVKTNQEIVDKYDSYYNDRYETLLGRMMDREPFSYDPSTDESYLSYQKQYTREGNRAMEDTMGMAQALSGGMMNSNAVTAGAMVRQYYGQKVTDMIPTLERNAYDRYVKEFELDSKTLKDMMAVHKQRLNDEYSANRDTLADIWANMEATYKRDTQNKALNSENQLKQQQLDFEKQKYQDDYNLKLAGQQLDEEKFRQSVREAEQKQMNYESQAAYEQLEREMTDFENAWNKAKMRGQFLDSEMEIIFGPDWHEIYPDGKPSPYANELDRMQLEYQLDMEKFQEQLRLKEDSEKRLFDYKTDIEELLSRILASKQ